MTMYNINGVRLHQVSATFLAKEPFCFTFQQKWPLRSHETFYFFI